jgi:large subunit ribosomal protein L29
MSKPAALKEKSKTELLTMERDLVQQLYKFRFQTATGAMENPAKVSRVKREIARIKTVLRERELQGEQAK